MFIPIAEATGIILSLGRWVIETACQTLAHWSRDPKLAGVSLSVNVSVRQFSDPDFLPQVMAVLERTQVPVQVGPELLQVDDGVADQLPRPMPGDIPAPLDLVNLDSARHDLLARHGQAAGGGAASKRDDRLMLHQEQQVVTYNPLGAIAAEGALQLQHLEVGTATEVDDVERLHDGSRRRPRNMRARIAAPMPMAARPAWP